MFYLVAIQGHAIRGSRFVMRMTHICPLLIDAMLSRDAHTQDSKLRSRRTPVQQSISTPPGACGGAALWRWRLRRIFSPQCGRVSAGDQDIGTDRGSSVQVSIQYVEVDAPEAHICTRMGLMPCRVSLPTSSDSFRIAPDHP